MDNNISTYEERLFSSGYRMKHEGEYTNEYIRDDGACIMLYCDGKGGKVDCVVCFDSRSMRFIISNRKIETITFMYICDDMDFIMDFVCNRHIDLWVPYLENINNLSVIERLEG